MGEAQHFTLDTSQLVPKWFVVLMDLSILVITAVGAIGLALQLNPASLFFAAFGVIAIGFLHTMVGGLRNPERNFVEVTDNALRVTVYRILKPVTVDIPYSTVERVEESVRHRFPQGLLGSWPYQTPAEHVDLRLRRARFLTPVWGGALPWVKTVHLQVMEPERFVAELRGRLAAASVSEPDSP